MTKRKTTVGDEIVTMPELIWWLDMGYWVYWYHKPMHPGFLRGMSLNTLLSGLRNGRIRKCLTRESQVPYSTYVNIKGSTLPCRRELELV